MRTDSRWGQPLLGGRSTPRIGWALLALSVALIAGAAVLVRGAPSDVPGLEVGTAEDVVDAVLDLAFGLVGALILTRQPRNLLGWTLLLAPLFFEASLFAGAYSTYGTFTHPGSLLAPQFFSLLSDVLFVPCLVLVLVFVPLLFPTGRPPTSRWVDSRRRCCRISRARCDLDGNSSGPGGRGHPIVRNQPARNYGRRRGG